jgi:histidyl-tRNA synthetase
LCGQVLTIEGAKELLDKLKQDIKLMANASAKKGLEDLTLLFAYLTSLAALKNVSFDLSLARGLDYYTGMIFEVITSASPPPPPPTTAHTTSTAHGKKKKSADPDDDVSESVGVGSICGGGRYDDLVGRFSGGARDLPCVGMSVGIERVFAILKAKHVVEMRGQETQVYLLSMGDVSIESRLEIMKELWDAGIKVPPSTAHFGCDPRLIGRRNSSTRKNHNTSPNNLNKRNGLVHRWRSWWVRRK